MDSVEWVQEKIQPYMQLEHPLTMMRPIKNQVLPDSLSPTRFERVQVWYDEEWKELQGPPGAFYRIGQRDSIGQWQGPVGDFYKNGMVQMKGTFDNNQRNGIFLYYSDHHTYQSVGRYDHDRFVGKWEQFHNNGTLKSEEYFHDGYFLKNMWDSLGNQLVKDGAGKYLHYYENGVIAEEGEYKDGLKQGIWNGRHSNGAMHFEEFFSDGFLVKGRSRTLDGQTYVYDESSLYPMPDGGNKQLIQYLMKRTRQLDPSQHGQVTLTFNVTTRSELRDFKVKNSLSKELDEKAIQFVREGPMWIPAREHGHLKRSGFARATIEF